MRREILLPTLVAARAFMVTFVGSLSVVMAQKGNLDWPGGPAWFLAASVGVLQALNALHSLYLPSPSVVGADTRPPSA